MRRRWRRLSFMSRTGRTVDENDPSQNALLFDVVCLADESRLASHRRVPQLALRVSCRRRLRYRIIRHSLFLAPPNGAIPKPTLRRMRCQLFLGFGFVPNGSHPGADAARLT